MPNYSKKTLEKMLEKAEKRFEKEDEKYENKIKNIGWGTWNRKWKFCNPSPNAKNMAAERVKQIEYQLSLLP